MHPRNSNRAGHEKAVKLLKKAFEIAVGRQRRDVQQAEEITTAKVT